MHINKLFLKGFRNYTAGVVSFDHGLNVIVGNNAQGKTNLLESIYFCALGRSPKTSREKVLIQYDKTSSNISVVFDTRAGLKNIDITLHNGSKKTISVNGNGLSKVSTLVGVLKVVYFSPDELKLIKEVPEDRRRFLDIAISQMDRGYLLALGRYEKVLSHRNNILKRHLPKEDTIQQLAIWDPQMIALAEKIISKRLEFIALLQTVAKEMHCKICPTEILDIEYSYKVDKGIVEDLSKKIHSVFAKECDCGYTLTGPHRDDLYFFINGKDCRLYASQGQQRSVALSIKLSEMEIFKQLTDEYPVLLLDDVMSELDEDRERRLCKIINNFQSIVTTTKNNIPDAKKVILIENGKIKK